MGELYASKAEAYQILPKAYLEKCGFKTREIYGQVANLTYISKEVKSIVRRKSPSDYREALEKQLSGGKIVASLEENDIPETILRRTPVRCRRFWQREGKRWLKKVRRYYYSV